MQESDGNGRERRIEKQKGGEGRGKGRREMKRGRARTPEAVEPSCAAANLTSIRSACAATLAFDYFVHMAVWWPAASSRKRFFSLVSLVMQINYCKTDAPDPPHPAVARATALQHSTSFHWHHLFPGPVLADCSGRLGN